MTVVERDESDVRPVSRRSVVARLAMWRSPGDQPGWCRPVLLGITALAALAYGWRLNGDGLEPYYAAAVRSMSTSWRDFLFGAFDPAGEISLDKLPGAFWPQALSVRLFGLHVWAIALPQVIEGALTVPVLFRAVRRLAGPVPGIVAAGVFAVSPATVLLNRGNIADTLLILLLVLAADAVGAALSERRLRPLLLAGVWVGLAFQAKMAQAWLVLPAFAVTYLIAAAVPVRRRLVGLAAAGAVTLLVSLSWMVLVTLVPAGDRPYVDGSRHNSVFEQVFGYNAAQRFGDQGPLQHLVAARSAELPAGLARQFAATRPGPAADRLLVGVYSLDAGWLLAVAAVVLIAVLLARRREPRTDPVRAAALLWGLWLVTFVAVFSAAKVMQPYYLGVLTPAVGALVGIGMAQAWRAGRTGVALAAALGAVTVGYQLWITPASGTGRPGWLTAVMVVAAVAALALIPAVLVTGRRRVGLLVAGAAVLVAPAVAAGSVVVETLGPFDTPYQPAFATSYNRTSLVKLPEQTRDAVPRLERARLGARYLLATSNGLLAADIIYVSGEEVLPIGGFTGEFPPPSLDQLRQLVASGQVHLVIALNGDDDARIGWIAQHCRGLPLPESSALREYYCQPANAG